MAGESLFVPALPLGELPAGRVRVVDLAGVRVALCNVDGRVYAVLDACTHDDEPLGAGALAGHVIECPRHGAQFDVRDGSVVRLPAAVPVRTFPVRVDNGTILVQVQE